MSTSKTLDHQDTTFLFDLVLQYRPDALPVSTNGKIGEYIGSGDGVLIGAKIKGAVDWTLFEAQSEMVCPANVAGLISTEDGARIRFEAIGFFLRPDPADPHRWVNSAAVHFATEDERYTWLNSILGVWQGKTDGRTWRYEVRVHAISR